jgi:hypothetical protein
MSAINNFSINPAIPAPGQSDLLSAAGKDIQLTIASFLEIKDVTALTQSCKKFSEVLKDNSFWALFAKKLGIHLSGNEICPKGDIRAFRALEKSGHTLHVEFARIIGPKKFADIPVLTLPESDRDYIDYVKVSDLSARVMKGVDFRNRPFIAFRVSYENQERVFTLFQRYEEDKETWAHSSKPGIEFFTASRVFKNKHFEYFIRLFKKQPCGVYEIMPSSYKFNDEPRTTPDGKSIIELA